MKLLYCFIFLGLFLSCNNENNPTPPVTAEPQSFIVKDTSVLKVNASIRALEVISDKQIWFAGSNGVFGFTNDGGKNWLVDSLKTPDHKKPHFRSIAHHSSAIFLMSIESPALLYKTRDNGQNWDVVYTETHPKAFYDAMTFWDEKEGIAMGDPTDNCMSIILTKNGGDNWTKIPCDILPEVTEGEAAFAASNGNIAVHGNQAWIVSGGKKARILHTPDRGTTWEVFDTPIVQGDQMTGIFATDFYDDKNGVIIGGDWNKPDGNTKNLAVTTDGGKTWQLLAEGKDPGYRSCIQYVPNTNGKELAAIGFPGLSYSFNGGSDWETLDYKQYYTLRFGQNQKVIWLAGKNEVCKMTLE